MILDYKLSYNSHLTQTKNKAIARLKTPLLMNKNFVANGL